MTIYYFMDILCGWCYGISDSMNKIKEKYSDKANFEIIPGGMWIGDHTVTVTPEFRKMILSHKDNIEQRLRVTFGNDYDNNILQNNGFILESLTGSKAIIAFTELNKENVFDYVKRLQHEHYVNGKNMSDIDTLTSIATEFKIDEGEFKNLINSDEINEKTLNAFLLSQNWNIQAFPTICLEKNGKKYKLSEGAITFDHLDDMISKFI